MESNNSVGKEEISFEDINSAAMLYAEKKHDHKFDRTYSPAIYASANDFQEGAIFYRDKLKSQPLSPQSSVGVEELLKKHYMLLDGACEEDWQEGRKDDMHKAILAAMTEYSSLMNKEKDREIERLKELVEGLYLKIIPSSYTETQKQSFLQQFKTENNL